MLPKTSIKFVPAEYHSQSAIAAAFELRRQIGDPERIREIEIATFRTAVEIIGKDPEKWRPKTRETADHSLPYCTAVALVDGEITAEQFTPERLRDPALLDLVARTSVVEDPKLTAGYPAGIPNRVTVTLDDGTKLVDEVAFPPATTRTRSPTNSSPSSSTAWSTRSWAAPAPTRSSTGSPGSKRPRPARDARAHGETVDPA